MNFTLSLEDYTIILNALHYYKKAPKRDNFQQYDEQRINLLRDRLAYQLIPSKKSNPDSEWTSPYKNYSTSKLYWIEHHLILLLEVNRSTILPSTTKNSLLK